MGFVSKDNQTNRHGRTVGICAKPIPSREQGITSVYFTVLLIARIVVINISNEYIGTLCKVGIRHKSFISLNTDKHFFHVKYRYCYSFTIVQCDIMILCAGVSVSDENLPCNGEMISKIVIFV